MKLTVQPGDTLTRLTQQALGQSSPSGKAPTLSFAALMKRMQTVANENQISNIDRIFPGQVIDFSSISATGRFADATASAAMAAPIADSTADPPADPVAVRAVSGLSQGQSSHRVLERTLERAVAKGYIPEEDVAEVRRRILDMSREYKFLPDDFARVGLIESDGFNPRATNGNCHGVIQFCDGPDRGAASVGFGKNPREILGMSVLEQLDLVDRYFKDTQLAQYRPASLDALYLTVLYPSARDERQMHKALPIPGPQASVLHVGGQQTNAITRASLRKGLIENANLRLTQFAQQQAKEALALSRQAGEAAAADQERPAPVGFKSPAVAAAPAVATTAVAPAVATQAAASMPSRAGRIDLMPELLPNFSLPTFSTESVLQSRPRTS
ncbi:MAG: hypothetical protein ACO3B4_06035 [Burkholderiaceae bacterium]